MRASDGRGYAGISLNTDQGLAMIDRALRSWPPDRHAYLLQLFEQVYSEADFEDIATRTMSALALVKLGELLNTWHGEVKKGLHDQRKDDHTGDDAG